MRTAPRNTLVVSTSSDDLLSPSPAPVSTSSGLRNSLSNFELNSQNKDRSLDYYNYCAPKLPAHSGPSRGSLRSKLSLSGHKLPNSAEGLCDTDVLSPDSPKYSKVSPKSAVASEFTILLEVLIT